jgi:hypothetical protein
VSVPLPLEEYLSKHNVSVVERRNTPSKKGGGTAYAVNFADGYMVVHEKGGKYTLYAGGSKYNKSVPQNGLFALIRRARNDSDLLEIEEHLALCTALKRFHKL